MFNWLLAKMVRLTGKGFENYEQAAHAIHYHIDKPAILNYIGENSGNLNILPDKAVWEYQRIALNIDPTHEISIKLSQLGYRKSDRLENLRKIGAIAANRNIKIWIDAEHYYLNNEQCNSAEQLKKDTGHAGLCLQLANPCQTDRRNTIEICIENNIKMRICKGAYRDNNQVYPSRSDLLERLLKVIMFCNRYDKLSLIEIATMRDYNWVAVANQFGLTLQLLYGWHKNILANTVTTPKIYVPYGRYWWPYIKRRLSGK